MSISSEITRIKNNIANCYDAVENKGGNLPLIKNSSNLADAIDSIPTPSAGIYWEGLYVTGLMVNPPQNSNFTFKSICYGNGLFVAIDSDYNAGNSRVFTSPDGINWTERSSNVINNYYWLSVCYGNGLFVAVGAQRGTGGGIIKNTNNIMTSPDGINWIQRTGVSGVLCSVGYGNGRFVAYGENDTNSIIISSTNGTSWTLVKQTEWKMQTMSNIRNNAIAYGNGKYAVVTYLTNGSQSINMYSSNNGTAWTAHYNNNTPRMDIICYGDGKFVGAFGNFIYYSYDAIIWEEASVPVSGLGATSICYGNGLFVIVRNSGTYGDRVLISSDGINWTRRTCVERSWTAVCYGNDRFVSVGTRINSSTAEYHQAMYSA